MLESVNRTVLDIRVLLAAMFVGIANTGIDSNTIHTAQSG